MSEISRTVNLFFNNATKSEVENLKSEILLSDRQSKIFDMFYVQKKDICFIADTLNVSSTVIGRELCRIRQKILLVA